jgi:CRP-like cAMP-binding protein
MKKKKSRQGLPKRSRKQAGFEVSSFLSSTGLGRKLFDVGAKKAVFNQGDKANAVYYLQQGQVRLGVVSKTGKEATIAILGPGDFIGEDSIATANPIRMTTATAITDSVLLKIEKKEILRVLHEEHDFADLFVGFLLARNSRIQSDLVDQLFNSSEKRLARTLLLLAQFGKPGKPQRVVARLSHETLAQMIGTTRSRVTFFLNRFRALGMIDYNGEMRIHNSLLNIILHD